MDALPPPCAPSMTAPCSQSASGPHPIQVRAMLVERLPNTRIDALERSRVPGLYLVRMADGRIAYTDGQARFLVLGVVFDLVQGQALDGALDAQVH